MRASGETGLDGWSAEQMWVRKGLMEKKGIAERENRGSISIDWSVI